MDILREEIFRPKLKSGTFVSLMKRVEERIKEANSKGDTEKAKKLETLYKDASPLDFLIETPALIADGKLKYCYVNRHKGFATIDETLTALNTLPELVKGLGYTVMEFETPKSLTDYINSNDPNPQPWFFAVLKFAGNNVVLLSPWSNTYTEELKTFLADIGLDYIRCEYPANNQLYPSWAGGVLVFQDKALAQTGQVPMYSFETIQKFLNRAHYAQLVPGNEGFVPGSGWVYEAKTYTKAIPLPTPMYLEVDGQKVTDPTKVKIKKDVNGTQTNIQFNMREDGLITFDVVVPNSVDFNTYQPDLLFRVFLMEGEQEINLDLQINVPIDYIPDPARVMFNLVNQVVDGNNLRVTFKLKDMYFPAQDNVPLTDVLCYLPGDPNAYQVERTDQQYTAIIPKQNPSTAYHLLITSQQQRRLTGSPQLTSPAAAK